MLPVSLSLSPSLCSRRAARGVVLGQNRTAKRCTAPRRKELIGFSGPGLSRNGKGRLSLDVARNSRKGTKGFCRKLQPDCHFIRGDGLPAKIPPEKKNSQNRFAASAASPSSTSLSRCVRHLADPDHGMKFCRLTAAQERRAPISPTAAHYCPQPHSSSSSLRQMRSTLAVLAGPLQDMGGGARGHGWPRSSPVDEGP